MPGLTIKAGAFHGVTGSRYGDADLHPHCLKHHGGSLVNYQLLRSFECSLVPDLVLKI